MLRMISVKNGFQRRWKKLVTEDVGNQTGLTSRNAENWFHVWGLTEGPSDLFNP